MMPCSVVTLVILCVVISTSYSELTSIQSRELFGRLTNMVFHGGKLYIGGEDRITVLNDNLETFLEKSTCSSSRCGNYNKVLLLDKDGNQLVICGTGENGTCSAWNLLDFTIIANSSVTSEYENFLRISTDYNTPVEALLTVSNRLMIAITYGNGIKTEKIDDDRLNTYNYAISTRNIPDFFILRDSSISWKLNFQIKPALKEYIIYYKSSFQKGGFSYFVTNQKNYVHGDKWVSKLVRICQNDTGYNSYTDINIQCNKGTVMYNLIQKAVLLTIKDRDDPIVIATFTKDSSTSETVLCSISLSMIDSMIMKAKKIYATSCVQDVQHLRYLPSFKTPEYVCLNATDFLVKDFNCSSLPKFVNVIGSTTAVMHSSLTLSPDQGYVTTLYSTVLNHKPVVMAGTSKGRFILMNYHPEKMSLTIYSQTVVHSGVNITAIEKEDDDTIYVMSLEKVFKFQNTNCSKFQSCEETMAARDPLCGWCVYEERSSRRKECGNKDVENHWLSSLEECVNLTVTPKGLPINNRSNLTIDVQNKPQIRSNDYYKCKFRNISTDTEVNATKVGDETFHCVSPYVTEHTEAVIEFLVVHGKQTIKLAETKFLFYDCETYMSCGSCVNTVQSSCIWCASGSPSCKWPNATCPSTTVEEKSSCPALNDSRGEHFIPGGVNSSVELPLSNMGNDTEFDCVIENEGTFSPAVRTGKNVTCAFMLPLPNASKEEYGIKVRYRDTNIDLDDDYNNFVTVYNCDHLADQCGLCSALNKKRYKCRWCNMKCIYNLTCDIVCPLPNITSVVPHDGPVAGGTHITIEGSEFGSRADNIKKVEVGTLQCDIKKQNYTMYPKTNNSEDFENPVPQKIVCAVRQAQTANITDIPVPVNVTVDEKISNSSVFFTYKNADVSGIYPLKGPRSGGTLITIKGKNLGIGNRDWNVILGGQSCTQAEVYPNVDLGVHLNATFTITCVTGNYSDVRNIADIILVIDKEKINGNLTPNFQVLPDPYINYIFGGERGRKGFLSGGTVLTVIGDRMNNSNKAVVQYDCNDTRTADDCEIVSDKRTLCKVPKLCKAQKNELETRLKQNSSRRKRETCSNCKTFKIIVKLDGIKKVFELTYFQDPLIHTFGNNNQSVVLYGTNQHQLVLKGQYLNLVATEDDFRVTVGVANCTVIELTEDTLKCSPPSEQPAPANSKNPLPEVKVSVGNIHVSVGYLKYERDLMIYFIAAAVGGGVLFIVVIISIIGVVKYRKVRSKAREYEQNLAEMEMQIKTVAREEFLDMHTSMSSVNKNLVEQGFPYHSYQQFACNVMFSVDYLWTEPVMTDDERMKANKGMESLESLIYNKFFLVSVISTMEKEKKFFIREKSNLAGNLCAVLMGKMDYLNEILKLLMTNLVQDCPPKKHKTLFRRCESITEKLLSNWVSLCLYPHIENHSGSPLYLLYMATQKTMEAGPIDAVTGDAKYTLSEAKLLKNWSSEDDNPQNLKFEAKTLTLNLVVDNGEEIFKCKVLDCDTISQVKQKCLNQIYVNYPASQLPVGANDLSLEWHSGFGGVLNLRDEDNTSQRDGHWVRLNTLAHYNVKDESNMALIDPHSADNQQEDYVNLAQVDMDGVFDGSMDSSEPLTPLAPPDVESPNDVQHWHLVKKGDESSKQGRSAIAELYLNRLFTTKQSLMEYMRPLFDIILDQDSCPAPTKVLFDFLDELGDRYRVDADTVHAWKSHSYAIRVWASLMKMPNLLYDVTIPEYMDDNLDIISQVFIESFSLTAQKFTKDTPSQKLIFHHEMSHYRERVKEFYKNVKVNPDNTAEFRQYLTEVNRLQQQTSFNKVSALYRLYKQLKPYFEDIIENLSTSKEASDLQLHRKLEQVIEIMEEEEEED